MPNPAMDWNAVTQPMREPLRQFAELVQSLGGDNVKALTLFGPIAAGSFDPERHSARSVLVVGRVDLAMLRQLAQHGARLGKARIMAPLIMTPEYIKLSLDTFPLEFIDIHQNHLTVLGGDYFQDLSFDDQDIRRQCERELKTILIGLRQGLLAAAGREKLVGALEQDAAEALLRTMRGLLWLNAQKDGRPAVEVVVAVEKLADRKLPGIRNALDPAGRHSGEEFEALYGDVEALGVIADAW